LVPEGQASMVSWENSEPFQFLIMASPQVYASIITIGDEVTHWAERLILIVPISHKS
jgi:hypothetical protein